MFESNPPTGITFEHQEKLPKLPIPPLEDTCRRYLKALEGLQDEEEHLKTKLAVREFLEKDGPILQQKLKEYARDKASYIEEFWYESYLSHSDPVVLALNPYFVLENDPTPDRGAQLPRAASLIVSSLGFIHDLRAGILQPDSIRGVPLDMDQYTRLFGTARIPTKKGCRMEVSDSHHIVVLRRGQFYWFAVMDENNRPLLTEREIVRNLQAIVNDADTLSRREVAQNSVGVLSTENRKTWSKIRTTISSNKHNAGCLEIVDKALFIVCLDDHAHLKDNLGQLCANFLCGTYGLEDGVQVGTCVNRWYDKLQIIVCSDGAAGINFEHTGVDGHTVLRFAADIFTEGLMLLARSINPSAPTLFHASLSPYAKSYKPSKGEKKSDPKEIIDTAPKKLDWNLTPELRVNIRFAETRISDLICQNDCEALEFKGYGKNFITSHGFSPDAFVQMAFQAAYFGLYGRIECVYEPAMTKAYLHGRTEAIRSVQPESVNFTKIFYSDAAAPEKVDALRKACERHVKLTKECSQGLGQDRHLYALYCLQRQINDGSFDFPDTNGSGDELVNGSGDENESVGGFDGSPKSDTSEIARRIRKNTPGIFLDPGWELLNTSILSTSNCGNPALRLFGFAPTSPDGYGIGYIIKDEGLSVCASSKHLQTRRFLDTLKGYLYDVQRMIIQLHRAVNEPPAPFVDHHGVLRDSKTGRPINGSAGAEGQDDEDEYEGLVLPEYSFFGSADVELVDKRKRKGARGYSNIGKVIPIAEY
ncbi:acyltransferase ChoActase/COT/CPT [Marasmius fiardii PR-910]|nr:acyltransferase ChoActase/COT/CPT [Marasmius fiardii PR-910]